MRGLRLCQAALRLDVVKLTDDARRVSAATNADPDPAHAVCWALEGRQSPAAGVGARVLRVTLRAGCAGSLGAAAWIERLNTRRRSLCHDSVLGRLDQGDIIFA